MLVSAKMPDPGVISCACWVGKLTAPYLLATGHDSGDILTWCLPENLQGVDQNQSMQFPTALHRLIVRIEASLGSPVNYLAFISGEEDGLLIFGGQSQEQPPGLTLLKLEALVEDSEGDPDSPEAVKTALPWFGIIQDSALVPPKGSMEDFDDPVGILVLTEFGNLILHDIKQDRTIPYSMPFQTCQQHSCITVFAKFSPLSPLQSLTSDLMLQMGGILDLDYLWVIAGGSTENRISENQSCCVLLVGYSDGSLRLWNLSNYSAPYCFLHLESTEVYQPGPISALEVLDDGKLLIIGDEKGQIFILQFSTLDRTVDIRSITTLDESPDLTSCQQDKGYQLLISIKLNTVSISKFRFDQDSNLLAILDQDGVVFILNLITLEVRMVPQTETGNTVVDLGFCEVWDAQIEATVVVLFLTDEDSGLLAIDAITGLPFRDSDWFRPRNPSKSVALYPLTEQGLPMESRNAPLPETESFFWTAGEVTGDVEVEEGSNVKEQQDISHSRVLSDDTETGALLAAAVAKLAEEKVPSPRTPANPLFLLVTDTYVRLYSTGSVLASVRAPVHKISLSQSIIWSTIFSMVPQEDKDPEGGLIVLTKDGKLHLIALPSLDILGTAFLHEILGFHVNQSGEDFFVKPNVIEGLCF